MSSKYIIIEKGSVEVPILFSHLIGHDEMAIGYKVVSAGFFEVAALPSEKDVNDIEVDAYGGSITLKLQARKEIDSKLIKEFLRRSY
jgi:hypothetical protein